VLVCYQQQKLAAMITLGTKNDRGDIGLLAVAPDFRGKGIAADLVYTAQHYFKNKNINKLQVVTQKDNIAACRLYEKCGFAIEKTETFFHFWL